MSLRIKRATRVASAAFFVLAVNAGFADDRLGLPPVPAPTHNRLTPEKASLGQALFLDKRFSSDGTVSCGSCHVPSQAYADGRTVGEGVGHKKGTRNAPSVLNAAYYTSLFWDGRVRSLEEQAKDPLVNPLEHGLTSYAPMLQIIQNDAYYQKEFKRVFGVEPSAINMDHVTMAIATYERTLIAGDSPFDRYQYRGDKRAMSPSAVEGLKVFTGKGHCADCHLIGKTSATFTDNQFHNIGVGLKEIQGRLSRLVDIVINNKLHGRSIDHSVLSADDLSHLGRFVVTINPADVGNFRTPGLRNVALTAPYMHDGSLKTLEEVVSFYAKGGVGSTLQDVTIRKLRLTRQEERQLVDFMEALTSAKFADSANQAATAGDEVRGGAPKSLASNF